MASRLKRLFGSKQEKHSPEVEAASTAHAEELDAQTAEGQQQHQRRLFHRSRRSSGQSSRHGSRLGSHSGSHEAVNIASISATSRPYSIGGETGEGRTNRTRHRSSSAGAAQVPLARYTHQDVQPLPQPYEHTAAYDHNHPAHSQSPPSSTKRKPVSVTDKYGGNVPQSHNPVDVWQQQHHQQPTTTAADGRSSIPAQTLATASTAVPPRRSSLHQTRAVNDTKGKTPESAMPRAEQVFSPAATRQPTGLGFGARDNGDNVQHMLPDSRDTAIERRMASMQIRDNDDNEISQIESPTNSKTRSSKETRSFLYGAIPSAEVIVARAKTNTADTTVQETIRPAVTEHTFTKDIHEIKQEVITREIHEHSYYHRVLPIIDVEVLPTRHFLPVAGGGLTEIAAEEVPARGKHWVIAETASKIRSDDRDGVHDQSLHGGRSFTARTFAREEGDFRKWSGHDGVERTEQTWVHHPEVEMGGRLDGQTWPLEISRKEHAT